MEIQFHRAMPQTHIRQSKARNNPYAEFAKIYGRYQQDARVLGSMHVAQHEKTDMIKRRVRESQEKLAHLAVGIYHKSGSLDLFETVMGHLLQHPQSVYHVPHSQNIDITSVTETPTTEEAVEYTIKGLKIAAEFAGAGKAHSTGVMLTGSLAYSPFYSVKGDKPAHLRKHDEKEVGKSDVDLLIIVKDTQQLIKLMQTYAKNGLLPDVEIERAKIFAELYTSNNADMFSVIATHGGMKESLHVLPLAMFERICALEETHNNSHAPYGGLKDFKPDLGFQSDSNGGFMTGDIKGNVHEFYPIDHQAVMFPDSSKVAGYITDKTVGWESVLDNSIHTYYIGVIGALLLSTPAIITESGQILTRGLQTFRKNISSILEESPIQYLPRHARMSRRTRAALDTYLQENSRRKKSLLNV